jgi:hypothetical protein
VCPFQLLCNSEPAGTWWYWNSWFKYGPVCKSKQPLQLMDHRLNWYLIITEFKSPCPKGNHSSGYVLDLSHIINSCQITNSHDSCSLSGTVAIDTVAKEATLLGNLISSSQWCHGRVNLRAGQQIVLVKQSIQEWYFLSSSVRKEKVMVTCLHISSMHLTQECLLWYYLEMCSECGTDHFRGTLHNILVGDHSSMSILVFISDIGLFSITHVDS